jgi:hypothetical protein
MDIITDTTFKSYIDLITYKQGITLYSSLSKNVFQNTILYGIKETGKTLLVKTILKELYNSPERIIQKEKLTYYSSSYYTFFDCHQIFNKQLFIQIIKEIVKSYNYYQDSYQLIIIDHFEEIPILYQNIFKVIFEKSYKNARFLLITNQLNRIINPIQSRCFMVRIKTSLSSDKWFHYNQLFQKDLSCKNNFDELSLKELNKQINLYGSQIPSLITLITKQIYNLCQESFSLSKIKELSNMIELVNISKTELFQEIISQFSKHYPNKIMFSIIHLLADYEHKLLNSFRDIIYLESIIIHLYKITHESL